jgi:hypothetical protein
MEFENKKLRDVADIAARIMSGQPVEEELKGGQVKLDKNHNNKLDSQDFKILRGEKKTVKEEETVEEGLKDMAKKAVKVLTGGSDEDQRKDLQRKMGVPQTGQKPTQKEEVELDEVKMADLPVRKVQGRAYGASKPEPHAVDTLRGPKEKELKDIESEKKKKKFSEMVDVYKTGGLKSFMESIPKEEELIDELSKDIADYTMDVIDAGEYTEVTIGEEVSEEEFNAEIKKAQAKSEGKDKAEVSKGSVQAVKQEETEITDEMIFEVLEESGIDFESLNDDELQEVVAEAIRVLDVSKSNAGVKPKTPEDRNKAAAAVKAARANKPTDRYTAKPVVGAGSVGAGQRQAGKPVSHIAVREDAEQVDERHMTDSEMEKREKIVKSMKKGMAGFKERYGDKAKNVMYATATKQAMK